MTSLFPRSDFSKFVRNSLRLVGKFVSRFFSCSNRGSQSSVSVFEAYSKISYCRYSAAYFIIPVLSLTIVVECSPSLLTTTCGVFPSTFENITDSPYSSIYCGRFCHFHSRIHKSDGELLLKQLGSVLR